MLGATTGLADGLLTLGQEDSHPGTSPREISHATVPLALPMPPWHWSPKALPEPVAPAFLRGISTLHPWPSLAASGRSDVDAGEPLGGLMPPLTAAMATLSLLWS